MSQWAQRRRTYAAGAHEYIYVTNHLGNNRDWPRGGNTFKKVEIVGSRYINSNKLATGFAEGDIFVEFGSGKAIILARNKRTRLVRYVVRELTDKQRDRHAKAFRFVERDLRWRRNSYVMNRHTK